MKLLTFEDLNPDKYLSVAIAATFVASAFHLNNIPQLMGCLVETLRWDSHSSEELTGSYHAAHNAAPSILTHYSIYSPFRMRDENTSANASASAFLYLTRCVLRASKSKSDYCDISLLSGLALKASADAILYSTDTNLYCRKKFIHDNLKSLLPIILTYKVNKSKGPFNSPEKVLDLLEDEDRQKFLFNLDILK